jgi:hypothetical protein
MFYVIVAHLLVSGWHLQISDLGDSAHALSTVSGSAAVLPTLISGRNRPEEWRDLPPLNSTKHQYLHVPPIAGLEDARDLADTIAPGSELDDSTLREICWFGAGSLAYIVTALRDIAKSGMRLPTRAH